MADTFEIVDQTPRTRSNGGGVFSSVTEITFKTKPSGHVATIDIPNQMFNVGDVERLVAAKAAIIESVQHL